MKLRQRITKPEILLTELLFGFLIFALIASISIRAFAKAKTINDKAIIKEQAVNEVSNAAETIRSAATEEDMEEKLNAGSYAMNNTTYTKQIDAGTITITTKETDNKLEADIVYQNKEETIYYQHVIHYFAGGCQ